MQCVFSGESRSHIGPAPDSVANATRSRSKSSPSDGHKKEFPENPKAPNISHSPSPRPRPLKAIHIVFDGDVATVNLCRTSTRPTASIAGLALEGLLCGGRLLCKLHESHFGGVFLGVVDELTVVPVASSYVSTLDGDGAGPSSAAP